MDKAIEIPSGDCRTVPPAPARMRMKSLRALQQHWRLSAVAALSFAAGGTLSGCAWTVITAADAVGSVTQAGFAVASQYSSPTFVSGKPAPVRHVCIELNNSVNDPDIVPALRVALSSYGVTSMVYNVGTSPPDCEARLTYNASLDFGHREFSDGYTRYLSTIDLTLQHGSDAVVAHYQTEGLNTDRFATTATKMRGLIKRMVISPNASGTSLASVTSNSPPANSSAYAISSNGAAAYATADTAPASTQPIPAEPSYGSPLPTTNAGTTAPQTYANYPSTPFTPSDGVPSATSNTAYKPQPIDPANTWHPKDQ